jgi:RNA polymerase sigma-70 factor (ECF subfamily)
MEIQQNTSNLNVSPNLLAYSFSNDTDTSRFDRECVPSANKSVSRRLREKDPQIIDELIGRYHQRLLVYLRRQTGARELAADISQDVWIRVLTHGSQFEGNSQFSTWLFSIAKNRIRDLRRRRPLFQSLDELQEDWGSTGFEAPSNEKSPLEQCFDSDNGRSLHQAMRALKPKHRRLVQLRYQRELSLDEITKVMGGSQSAVKASLHRAVQQLRQKIASLAKMTSARYPIDSTVDRFLHVSRVTKTARRLSRRIILPVRLEGGALRATMHVLIYR